MLRAFWMARTLNRKGRLPSDALKRWMTLWPMSAGFAARCSARVWLEVSNREGDFG